MRTLLAWITGAAALFIATLVIPGAHVNGVGAIAAVAVIAVLNAFLPPLAAALRLPLTLATGFLLILVIDPLMLLAAARLTRGDLVLDSFWSALGVALVASAVSLVLEVILGTNDDDTYTIRVIQRIARRSRQRTVTDASGIVFLEIDGLALPVLQRAMRDGSAPNLAAWLAGGSHRLVEWETDLSSQTGASQAGILLGDNEDITAFRWVEKESRRLMTCSAPKDCAEIERRHVSGRGLLAGGGASRGNLLSGEADEVILTASRIEAERHANPGYRAFFANGFNVTRSLVLFMWEVALEWTAATRAVRRNVRPRGHRGGKYPFLRAALCVVVRDLIVYGVLMDMMKGRPAIYATFSSYDEVAHHSGLERADTMEALRKLDQQIARIDQARPFAARPYSIVVLSDHGQTQGATFKQRNGYGLDELVRRSIDSGSVPSLEGGDENDKAVGHAFQEAGASRTSRNRSKGDISDEQVVVLGSGNLGLVYLMDKHSRMTVEEIEARHPRLIPALRQNPNIGWLLVRSEKRGPLALGPRGTRYLSSGEVDGTDPLAGFSPNAPRHLMRTDGFEHVADVMVGSFYDGTLEEACAFEELISFHGGLGGTQTRPFLLYPAHLPDPEGPIIGACQVHDVLLGWRRVLNERRLESNELSMPPPAGEMAASRRTQAAYIGDRHSGGNSQMSHNDTLMVLAASYDKLEDAEADFDAIKALYKDRKTSDDFDAAVLAREADGSVKVVKKHEQPTRHGAAHGLAWGLAIGAATAIFPPVGLLGGMAVGGAAGAAIGAVRGHVKGGMKDSDLKEIGAVLERGQAGLIAVYETNLADQIGASIKAKNRQISKQLDADADELVKELHEVQAGA